MKSIIIGAGTYGEVYLAYLQEAGVQIVGFLDDNIKLHNTKVSGIDVLGGRDMLPALSESFGVEAVYCPIGNNKLRVKFLSQAKALGYKTPSYVHSSVILPSDIVMGDGVYILPGSIIMPYATIKDYVMVSMGVNIAHHSVLDEGVFLSAGCNFGASIHAKKYAYCGIGSIISTGIKELGESCLVGAGAVVIRDVPDHAVVAGVPAKVIKYNDQ